MRNASRLGKVDSPLIRYRDFVQTFRQLGLGPHSRVVAHASLSAFGEVQGGVETMAGAMMSSFDSLMMPTFTYRTMIVPPVGPPENGLDYDVSEGQSRMAEFWRPGLPADPLMGVTAEALRQHKESRRSHHPILSFSGVNVEEGLQAQSLENPLAPLRYMADQDGDILLLGVNHTKNTSIHLAEKLAGRKQFLRWALTADGVMECPGWPGCSDGFQAIATRLKGVARRARLGDAWLETVPMRDLLHTTVGWIRQDPRALLCTQLHCERCRDVRASVRIAS